MAGKMPKSETRDGVDNFGRTPLHYAAADSRSDEVAILVAAGASINAQDNDGWTPLHFAAQAACAKCTKALLQAKANTALQDSFGNTALWRAVFESKGNGSIIQLLLQAGANPHVENEHGISPLALARTITNYDIAQFFSGVKESESEV